MEIKIDIKGIKETTDYLKGTDRQISLATTRAIRKTLVWVKSQVKKDIAAKLKVTQKSITSRIRTSVIKNGETSGALWGGMWSLSPYALGTPRQIGGNPAGIGSRRKRSTLGGVSLGSSRFYRGAFIKNIYGDGPNIWIRKNSKHFNPELFPGRHWGQYDGGYVLKKLRGRFPVVKAQIVLEDTMREVFDRADSDIRAEFDKKLRGEINYAVNIERVKRNR
jgi:hypothetical protein